MSVSNLLPNYIKISSDVSKKVLDKSSPEFAYLFLNYIEKFIDLYSLLQAESEDSAAIRVADKKLDKLKKVIINIISSKSNSTFQEQDFKDELVYLFEQVDQGMADEISEA